MNDISIKTFPSAVLGQHIIADFHGARNLLEAGPSSIEALTQAADAAGAVVLDVRMHDFGDRAGYTGVALLAESHISVHTWPEYDYVAVDIFMCGDAKPELSLNRLRDFFQPSHEEVQTLRRGQVPAMAAPVSKAPA